MKCLSDILCGKYALVGIKDFVNCPHPETILYINDIPGITMKSAAAIANDEQRTAFNLLNDKIKQATKTIFHRFSAIVSNSFNFNAFIESRDIHKFTNEVNPVEAEERGLILRRWDSEMAKIYIEQLYIRVANSGIAYVKIYDGDITKIFEVSLLADTTMIIDIKYKCENEEVKVVFDQTNFQTYTCKINDQDGCSTCGPQKDINLEINGWDGEEESDKSFGMGILASVQCFEEEIICQLLPRMGFLIWYQSGIEVFEEHISSSRINPIVTFTKDQAIESKKRLEIKMAEEEKDFKQNVNMFLKNTRGECFSCKGSRSVYVIP